MARKVQVKCVIAGCRLRLKMALAEREELRQVGRESNAAAGLVCPAHVKAAFDFEFEDIDIDVPLEKLLVEASRDISRWRVMLTPLPGRRVSRTANPRQGGETGLCSSSALACGSYPSASIRRVQLARPAGGFEQARAIRWASPAPSSFFLRRFNCCLRPRAASTPSSTHRPPHPFHCGSPYFQNSRYLLVQHRTLVLILIAEQQNAGVSLLVGRCSASGYQRLQFLLFFYTQSHPVFLHFPTYTPASPPGRLLLPHSS